MTAFPCPTRCALLALVPALLFCLCFSGDVQAKRRRAPLVNVLDTAWIFSGSYVTKAKRMGLKEYYTVEFIVDFFADSTFNLQCLPIEAGAEDDFFSGRWKQRGNKIRFFFDEFSRQLLAEIFAGDLEIDLGGPVDVFIEKWVIKSKLKRDRTGGVLAKFKEKLQHLAVFEGRRIRVKTRGRGTGEFFENIGDPGE